MFIQTEATPNPATLKFIPGKSVLAEGTADFTDKGEALASPLASRLFDIKGVRGVFLGSLAGAGTLGILIPPSIMMVVYAVQANVSIIQVFLAGFLPGLLVMALYSGYIAIWSLANPARTPPAEPPTNRQGKRPDSYSASMKKDSEFDKPSNST